ncbi:MAG: Gfo/Idh/MocA family protein [Streptosporangiales bacterium]
MTPPALGVGLIGVGWMGRLHGVAYRRVRYHYPHLAYTPRLVVASDTSDERVGFAVRELGYETGTADWREVVKHPDVDVVSITAPNFLHEQMALAAAEAGKHVWIEKPLGRGLAETAAIEHAVRTAGVFSAVGFNYRHAPCVAYARELVASGGIGRVTHARGAFLNDYAAEPKGALSWRFRRAYGGSGALGDLMSHAVDLLQYVLSPVRSVCAQVDTFIPQRPVPPAGASTHFAVVEDGTLAPVENEDYAGSLVRFESGASGMLEASRATVGPRCGLGFDIHGTSGAVSWDFERMNEVRVCLGRSGPAHGYTTVHVNADHGDYAAFQPGPTISMSYDDLKVIEAALLLRSIATGKQVGPHVGDALSAARVVDAMETSARSERWERVEQP